MEYFEIKKEVNAIYESLKNALNSQKKEEEIKILEKKMLEADFWESNDSLETVQKLNHLKSFVADINEIKKIYDNIEILLSFISEGDDDSILELNQNFEDFKEKTREFSNKILLNDKYDFNNAILTINAGAGGTEACDWASMLFRMFERWANHKKYKIEVLDMLSLDEAGIKSITFNIKGDFAYGYLKTLKGVHRLVRISPFDSNKRRHTSFAAVNVIPEIENDNDINLNMSDIEIDTYRASGAGGQHVNTTDSAVRITHKPTNIVVTCQNERSQLKNKESALKVLKAKLFELEELRKEKEIKDIKGEENKIEWGSQIMSYVMQPYKLIKDHRTKYEEGNIEKVLDGDIDPFIYEYLKFKNLK